ncbi:transposase [Paracoccus sp. CPCC 101403]|uniref:Transposase n=1 Tax=Paracoccus broussonetiae TaxID=3075834 RepID=A0ABU3EIW8_9RHOB|nr:transposase [Paracoccus sp. CPCC 101403]
MKQAVVASTILCPKICPSYQRTRYKELDQLLARLHRRRNELLKVLERPEIPLHTNAYQNDLRACVTKRRTSRGTMAPMAARHATSCLA